MFEDLGPVVRVGAEFEIAGELVDAQVAFFLFGAVASDAVFFEEGLKGGGGVDQGRQEE